MLTDRSARVERRSERVARMLSERITHHELTPGSKLPSESALAGHFGVSRAVVREAIAMLKAEGLVETLQGSGAYVRSARPASARPLDQLTRASVRSLLDLITVRGAIEGEMAAVAALNRTAAQLERIDEALDRLGRAEMEGRSGVDEDREFHALVAEATGNLYWSQLTETLAGSITIAMAVTRENEALRRDFAQQVALEHRELRDAIAQGNPERARAAAAQHMSAAAERIRSADREFWNKGGARVLELRGGT